jgi:hypothetical protein
MEFIGTGFVLTIGSVRLRCTEETPLQPSVYGKAQHLAREEREDDHPGRRS